MKAWKGLPPQSWQPVVATTVALLSRGMSSLIAVAAKEAEGGETGLWVPDRSPWAFCREGVGCVCKAWGRKNRTTRGKGAARRGGKDRTNRQEGTERKTGRHRRGGLENRGERENEQR